MAKCWKCERTDPFCGFASVLNSCKDGTRRPSYACRDCEAGDGEMARHRRRGDMEPQFPHQAWGELLEYCDNRCSICLAKGRVAIDHIHPFSRGGALEISNLCPLCQSCNSRKMTAVVSH